MHANPNVSARPNATHWIGTANPKPTELSRQKRHFKKSNGRAKILDKSEIEAVRNYIRQNSTLVESDELKFLLSVHAGLRAAEIAALQISALVSADGRISKTIELRSEWTKSHRARSIPMHRDVQEAMKRFRIRFPSATYIAISKRRGGRQLTANAVTVWFHELYAKVGFQGCSSHSGRRTFITALARRANEFNRSLRDVQQLAGHRRLDTTESYIEPADDLDALVNSL